MVHDEECKVATDALDPHIEPRPHAGVLFEAGAIQTRRRLYSDTVTARRAADARKRQQRAHGGRPIVPATTRVSLPGFPSSLLGPHCRMRCEAAAGVPELSAELSQDCPDIRDNFESDSTRGLFKIVTVSEMTGLDFYVVDFTSTEPDTVVEQIS